MAFYPYDTEFNGITRHLKRAEDKEKLTYVTTSSSSHLDDEYGWGYSDVILNDKHGNYSDEFASANIPYSNVSVYLLKHKLRILSYSISTRFSTIHKLKKWNLYGSNDNNTWHFIDEQGPTDDIVVEGSHKNYNVQKVGTFRYFRITQTAPTQPDNVWLLIISRLEFFGYLYPNYQPRTKQFIFHFYSVLFVILSFSK